MTSSIVTLGEPGKSPAMIDFPGNREIFDDFDSIKAVACVPQLTSPQPVALNNLKDTDLIRALDLEFIFKGNFGAYDYTADTGPGFPYNFVQSIELPYQTGGFKAFSGDGHMLALVNMIRSRLDKYGGAYMLGQAADMATGYSAQANANSAADYVIAASTAKTYQFSLRVPISLWFDRFYDRDRAGSPLLFRDVDVTPLLMSAPGKSVLPSITLAAVKGTRVDQSPVAESGLGATHVAWTDGGSTLTVRRQGIRQPGDLSKLPPIFNWIHNYEVRRIPLNGGTVDISIPSRGQLLSVIGRMFDPTLDTLATNVGDAIPVANLSSMALTYGAGIVKFNDSPKSMQNRVLRQHGIMPTEGVIIWDMYADTRSNVDAINTYNTAGVTMSLDFGTNVPGAGSYIDVCMEFLTLAGG